MPSGLGRGLDSLISSSNNNNNNNKKTSQANSTAKIPQANKEVFEVDINTIVSNPYQPRKDFQEEELKELVDSIKIHGIIQPLIVTETKKGYELIAGERRLRASKEAGLKKVPVVVKKADKQKKLELALIENLQRENLNPVDTALAYKQLMENFNFTQEEAAQRVGKARSSVTNSLRYLNLAPEIQRALSRGDITEGHAKYLLGLESEKRQLELFKKIIQHNLSVNDTQKAIKKGGGSKHGTNKEKYLKDQEKEDKIQSYLGTKVEIRRRKAGGQIVIDFFDDDVLNSIIDKIS